MSKMTYQFYARNLEKLIAERQALVETEDQQINANTVSTLPPDLRRAVRLVWVEQQQRFN